MHKLCVHCFEILALTAKQARKASQLLVQKKIKLKGNFVIFYMLAKYVPVGLSKRYVVVHFSI
jgi:hypothetical protein